MSLFVYTAAPKSEMVKFDELFQENVCQDAPTNFRGFFSFQRPSPDSFLFHLESSVFL